MEIGESLVYSWLKHVKKCSMIQSNWKPSKSWLGRNIDNKEEFIQEIRLILEKYEIAINIEDKILKNIMQTEVDVIGIEFAEKTNCYAIESAFHEQGLHYKGQDFKVIIIIKLIKAAFVIYENLKVDTVEIVFVSPILIKKNKIEDLENLKLVLNDLSELFSKKFTPDGRVKFDVYFEEVYQSELISSIFSVIDKISDQSESFVRALKLVRLFKDRFPIVDNEENNKPQIGKYARESITKILISSDPKKCKKLVNDLTSKEKSKKIFGTSYSVLISEKNVKNQQLEKRYYKDKISIDKENYFICSQWYVAHYKRLVEWVNSQQI